MVRTRSETVPSPGIAVVSRCHTDIAGGCPDLGTLVDWAPNPAWILLAA